MEEWVHRAVVMKRAIDDEGGDETVFKKIEVLKKKRVKKEVAKDVKTDVTAAVKKSVKPRATTFPKSIPKSQQVSVSSFDFANTGSCRRLVIRRYFDDIGQSLEFILSVCFVMR